MKTRIYGGGGGVGMGRKDIWEAGYFLCQNEQCNLMKEKKKTAKASSSSSLSLLFVSYLLLLLLTLEVVKPCPVHSWSCSAQVWVHVVFQDGSAWTGHRVC